MDAVDYKNGAKNQWRRRVWNVVQDTVRDRKDAIVLYLPGSTDLDRDEALHRGFKPANLIAIERCPAVIAKLRAGGTTVIPGDLIDVLSSWPPNVRLGAVLADVQHGIGQYTQRLADLYVAHPALNGCTLVVNLQRGRDDVLWRGDHRKHLGPEKFISYYARSGCELDEVILRAALATRIGDIETHRGVHFLIQFLRAYVGSKSHKRDNETLSRLKDPDYDIGNFRYRFAPIASYRSTPSSPVFDSAFVRYEGLFARDYVRTTARAAAVNAALAIRTRRLRGELRGRAA